MKLEKFETTILPLKEKLFATALKMLASEDEAEDAVQEALIRLWQSKKRLSNHPNVGGYAMQTLKNVCLDKIKANKHNMPLEGLQLNCSRNTPYEETEYNDSAEIVKQIIGSLPGLQRLTIQLRDIEEYELEEIAKITGTNVGAVKVNLSRARKKVRDEFVRIQSLEKIWK